MSHEYRTLVEMLEHNCKSFSPRPLFGVRRYGTWSWMSYLEFSMLVEEIRSGLSRLGVREGERVGVVSRNTPEWAGVAYATFGLGAVLVPMYEAQLPSDWEHVLRDSGTSVVIGRTSAIANALLEMQGRLPALRHVLVAEAPDNDPRSLAALRRDGRLHHVPPIQPDPSALAQLIYTSGTTGKPKGVMLSHGNFASNARSILEVFPMEADDRTLSFLPWAHAYGQIVDLHLVIATGASTALNEDIRRLQADMAQIAPTMLMAVPKVFHRMHVQLLENISTRRPALRRFFELALRASIKRRRGHALTRREQVVYELAERLLFSKVRARFGGRLRASICGSAALSSDVAELMGALGLEIYEGYGLTEASPIVSANRPDARKLGSVGRPIPGVTVRIDTRRGEAPGQGEIIVYGPNVMLGYLNLPEETAQTLTEDGGLRTGDLGYLDDDGFLYVSGRISELYKLDNGKYVTPTPIEERLGQSPYIQHVLLYGPNQPYNVALVVLDWERVRAWAAERDLPQEDREHHPALRALIADELERLSAEVPRYARPRAFALTSEPLTAESGLLTPTLKPRRKAVLARYLGTLEALYDQQEPSRPERARTAPPLDVPPFIE